MARGAEIFLGFCHACVLGYSRNVITITNTVKMDILINPMHKEAVLQRRKVSTICHPISQADANLHFVTEGQPHVYVYFGFAVCQSVMPIKLRPKQREVLFYVQEMWQKINGRMLERMIHNEGHDNADQFWSHFKGPFQGSLVTWEAAQACILRPAPSPFQLPTENKA